MNDEWMMRLKTKNKDHRVIHYLCPFGQAFFTPVFFWFLHHAEIRKKAKNLRSYLQLLLSNHIFKFIYLLSCSHKLSLQLKLFLCLKCTREYWSKCWIIIFNEQKLRGGRTWGLFPSQENYVIKQATVNPDCLF